MEAKILPGLGPLLGARVTRAGTALGKAAVRDLGAAAAPLELKVALELGEAEEPAGGSKAPPHEVARDDVELGMGVGKELLQRREGAVDIGGIGDAHFSFSLTPRYTIRHFPSSKRMARSRSLTEGSE